MHLPIGKQAGAFLCLGALFSLVFVPQAPARPGAPEGPPRAWTAAVIDVGDGDSFKVRRRGKVVRVRLYGIDSPEFKQRFGREARQTARRLLAGREVRIRPVDRDPYGRDVALVWAGEVLVNREMVRQGAAWMYPRFCKERRFCAELAQVQEEARRERRGLWRDERPETPWDWKRRHPKK